MDFLRVLKDLGNGVSSGVFSIDELRDRLGSQPTGTELGRKHFITKNFELLEKMVQGIEEGG